MIAQEAVLLPGDLPLREITAALAPKGLDLLELTVGDLTAALRRNHAQRRAVEAAARRKR
jgi:hypothetical protein